MRSPRRRRSASDAEFLLTLAPIRFRYGTGSPVDPVAVF